MAIVIRLAALAAGVAALAPAAGAARDPWAPLHRPLRLAPLAAGAPCPVSKSHPIDGGGLSGVGTGPIFAFPSPFGAYDRKPPWLGSKTIWAWPAALTKRRLHVLVRGARLDAPGAMGFQLGPQWDTAPVTRELRVDTTRTVGSFSDSSWGTTVTMLLVRVPGCYGLQLDSERGTSTLIVQAR